MLGKFVTFEGIDGSGKTTQINLLEEELIKCKISYEIFREPGGTKLSEKIRQILLDKETINLSPEAESLLFVAARSQLVSEKIIPALKKNKFVICDRYCDSTIAYQGYGRGLNIHSLNILNNFGTQNIQPDLTILLDVNPERAFARFEKSYSDRMELLGNDFFKKVQNGYHEIAKKSSNRYIVINGEKSVADVFNLVYSAINKNILKEIICN